MKFKTVLLACALALAAAPAAQAFDLKKLDLNKLKEVREKVKPLKEMSESDEIAFGKDVAANVLGAAPPVNDPALQGYVNQLGLWIAMHSDRPNLPWHFAILDSNDVNAFSTPGGYVLITRGLLLRCRDEAEFAGVLAHEISHVTQKHALNAIRKGAWTGLATDALADYAAKKGGENYRKAVSAGTEVYARGLDKDDEFEADRRGVVLAARAGYDPYGLAGVLQTLSSINPESDSVALLFKTHPNSEKRLELLVAAMEGNMEKFADLPRVANRFESVIQTHSTKYAPAKQQ
jgi:beta-barrel assembly-enhancing protease